LPEGFVPIPLEPSPTVSSSSSTSSYPNSPGSHSDDAYPISNPNEHKHSELRPSAENDWESVWREMEQVGDDLGLISSILMYQQNDTSANFYGNLPADPAFEMLHTVFPEADKPYAVPDVLNTDALERWFRSETH
jgi:hypothetical protein